MINQKRTMRLAYYLFFAVFLTACIENTPNQNEAGEDVLQEQQTFVDAVEMPYNDTVYVPIYSDIYSETKQTRFLLTATLSIRNTSLEDTIYIRDIDYYDTDGALVREYIDRTILLRPMQSIDYVIEERDKTGGTGANFIINWCGKSSSKPIFQGIMVSTNGQQGMSFLTEGVSVSRR